MMTTEAIRKATGDDWQVQIELIHQARADFQVIREAAFDGDDHPAVTAILAAGEDAFIEAQLDRWNAALLTPPRATTGVPLNIRALGAEREVLMLL